MINTLTAAGQDLPQETYYPWKSKSGLFGYSNTDGKLKIDPKFEEANVFTNQFAIVEKNNKKGVIDHTGAIKLDFEYDKLELAAWGNETIAITCKSFNAWWKFNKWNFFPGFSVMGGTNDKRIVDTKVLKMNWKVILLNTNQTIIDSDHNPNQYPFQASDIYKFQDKILINDQLYGNKNGQIKQISSGITANLTDGTLLRRKGDDYQILNKNLKPIENTSFKVPVQITVEINGKKKELKTETINAGIKVKLNFMEDQHQHIFAYPDLSKTFPKKIDKYFNQEIEAESILSQAQLIYSVPNTVYFIIRSFINNKTGFYILNQNGTWESDRRKTKDFVIRSNSGRILYPDANVMGIEAALPKSFNVKWIEQTQINKSWFRVTATNKTDSISLSGIFDIASRKWVLPLKYTSLEKLNSYPNLWRFELGNETDYRKKKYGLIDILTSKITVEPQYNSLDASANAGTYNGEKWDYFYINPLDGKEYREIL
ncbi:WG repeat-containing protein [Pedobacter sp. N23S346]|uniref:WG repeat-containing protein n=1 Tax=Pedobacter sp. N23S346 TaxID=3402750 RepID=UPI003AC60F99